MTWPASIDYHSNFEIIVQMLASAHPGPSEVKAEDSVQIKSEEGSEAKRFKEEDK